MPIVLDWNVQQRLVLVWFWHTLDHLLCVGASCLVKPLAPLKKKEKTFLVAVFFLPAHDWLTASLRHEGVSSCATQGFQRAFMALSQMSSWLCHARTRKRNLNLFNLYTSVHIWHCALQTPSWRWLPSRIKRISAKPLRVCVKMPESYVTCP